MMPVGSKQGFSLPELLLVLLILGNIAAFSIPKVLSAQTDAKKTAILKETYTTVNQIYYQGHLQGLMKQGYNGSYVLELPYAHEQELLGYMLGRLAEIPDETPHVLGQRQVDWERRRRHRSVRQLPSRPRHHVARTYSHPRIVGSGLSRRRAAASAASAAVLARAEEAAALLAAARPGEEERVPPVARLGDGEGPAGVADQIADGPDAEARPVRSEANSDRSACSAPRMVRGRSPRPERL